MVNLKIYDDTHWTANNYNRHIVQYHKKDNQKVKFGHSVEYNMRNTILEKSYNLWWGS